MTNKNLHLYAPLALLLAFWVAACAGPAIVVESMAVAVTVPPQALAAFMVP